MVVRVRDISLSFPKVVVGSSLEALTYSFLNDLPFFSAHLDVPHQFDRFEPEHDLSLFKIENQTTTLHTPGRNKIVGIEKSFLWERLYFYLSLAGLNPLSDCASSIRFENDSLLAFTHKGARVQIKFDKAVTFSDQGVYGLPEPMKIKKQVYKVYDWFDVRRGMTHEFDLIRDNDKFVSEVLFYPSKRADNTSYKDAVAVSYLSEEQLSLFDYSDISAKFKTLHLMKEAGIKGPRNGRDQHNKEKYKYYSIRIENSEREVIPTVKMTYKSSDTIEYKTDKFDDIVANSPMKDSYVTRIYR